MTDYEIEALLCQYANEVANASNYDMTRREYDVIILESRLLLEFLLRDHYIVSKEKVKDLYNCKSFGGLDFIEVVSCRRILESLFGKSVSLKKKENGDESKS